MAKGAFNFNNLLVALRNFFTSTGVTAGIDMGSSALKIIELKKTKAGYTLNDFIFAPIPPAVRLDEIQRNQFIINSLKEAMRDGKIRSLGAYVLLSGSEVNIICVTIPKLKQSDFQKALLLEIKKQIAF